MFNRPSPFRYHHFLRGLLPASVPAAGTVQTRGQPCDTLCSQLTVRPDSKATAFHISSLLLLPPSRYPQIMPVLSERPTVPTDTSQPPLTPDVDLPIAIPDVVVNGRKQADSASLPHRRPKSSSSNRSAGANDEWGSNFWVTLVDPQVGGSL